MAGQGGAAAQGEIARSRPDARRQIPARAAFAGPVRHVYVHVPFCTARCDYCDFYSTVAPAAAEEPAEEATGRPARGVAGRSPRDAGDLLDAYVAALVAEWRRERAAHAVRRLETLYLGGGTPALLGLGRLERVVAAFDPWLTPRAEVTLETNPDEAGDAFAAWAAARGVRVSLGVQSFLPKLRAALGRRPSADPAAAVRRLRSAGVRDLSIDLIHGVPGQSAYDVDADLAAVADLAPAHVSWYELEVAAGTPLARRLAPAEDGARRQDGAESRGGARGGDGLCAAPVAPPGDDERAALYRRVVRGLERLGYRWYEVSSFARPGHRARHNVAYWRARPYLGLGPGAVSTVGRKRWRNVPDASAYIAALTGRASRAGGGPGADAAPWGRAGAVAAPPREVEALAGGTLARERLLLAARCGLPVPLSEVGATIDPAALTSLCAAGLLSLHSGTIRVTRKGRYVANEVCVRLFRA